MDDTHAQWSAVCDFCDNTAEHYCKSCGIKLCSPCKDDHLSKKLYRHHKAVPYTSGVGQTTETQTECSNHPGKRYQLYCKPCEVPVCLTCIVESHVQHKLVNITDAYEAIKPIAMSQLQTISQTIRPCLQKELEGLSNSQEEILTAIADIEQRMKDRAQHIHKEVDDILAENMKEIQKIKDDTIMPLLQEEVRKTKEKLDHFAEEILSYDMHLRSADPVDLLKFMKQWHDSVDMPTTHVDATQLLPSFTPGCISRESLQQQFGKLVTVDHTKSSTPIGSKSESGDIKSDNSNRDGKVDTLYTKHEQDSTTLKLIPNPVCENGDHRFTYTGHGSDSRFIPYDLCSDRQGRLLITDCNYHRIHIVDQDGLFIQYLATQNDGILYPMSIDVDDHGHTWVREWGSHKVKIIRYLQ